MNDLRAQIEQMQKMGGMEGVMGMMPGMAKMSKQVQEAGLDDRLLRRQIALIDSMTKRERAQPAILQASRKKRIAKGAGLEVSQLNQLLKMHRQMSDMMKKMGKGGMLKQAMRGMFGGGGPSPAELQAAQAAMGGAKGMPQMPGGGLPGTNPFGGGGMQLPPGLSGFGKKR